MSALPISLITAIRSLRKNIIRKCLFLHSINRMTLAASSSWIPVITRIDSRCKKIADHRDVLSGIKAVDFRNTMGAALTLRLERLKRSLDAYTDARVACVEMEGIIKKKLKMED